MTDCSTYSPLPMVGRFCHQFLSATGAILVYYWGIIVPPSSAAMFQHVFLSYSVKDLYGVRRVRDALTAQAIACWPARILTPGTDYWLANARVAASSAACIVVVLSPDTLESRWVALALKYAAEYGVPVIPAVVSGEPGHILLVKLDGSDWFDLRYRSRFAAEITALAALVRQHMRARLVEMA